MFSRLCIIGVLSFGCSFTFAQNQQVRLSGNNITLKAAFKQIEQQTKLFVDYNVQDINDTQIIKQLPVGNNVQIVLEQLLEGTNCVVTFSNGHVIISKKAPVSSKTKKVTGVVKDENGEPIIGANVVERGTTNGIITDMDGKFMLEVPEGAIIQVSYIGYISQGVKTGNKTQIDILLKEDTQALDEVVVVGYGTQKKVNLSGSVASINVEKLTESRPITNISHALAGMAAGVNVQVSNNKPGENNASIKVRGQGTLNNSSPLVIVDGVESDINSVNPQDIEAISIMKDAASSSIYGSRAANGVILITTKQGKKGTLKIDYNGYVSFDSKTIPSSMDALSDYAMYMELFNEGYRNINKKEPFSQEIIDEWRADGGKNPLKYPNTNWIDETFRPATATNHVLSMSGGNEKIRFYSSFGYQNTPGVMENTGYEKYNGRINISADVKPWLMLGAQASGAVSNMDPASPSNVFSNAMSTTPGMVFRAPDGRYGAMNNPEDAAQSANNNPLKMLNQTQGKNRSTDMNVRFTGTLKPFKGFSITGSYSYNFWDNYKDSKPKIVEGWDFRNEVVTYTNKGRLSLTNSNSKRERFFGDVVARYENRFVNNKLDLKAMVGASQELYRTHSFSAKKLDLIDLNLNVLNAAIGEASASGTSSAWSMRSYFGRVNLGWEDKYLLELNLRVDQSSRFLPDNRTGYFPSGSVAWRMEQEGFMENLRDKGLSNLKLRFSYGELGNNSVDNYDALATYQAYNYSLNKNLVLGMAQTTLANAGLSWESTAITNVGVDLGLFNGKLNTTLEYFHKRTRDILISLPAPDVHGLAGIPKQNSAIVTNQGLEVTMGWNDHVGDFSYGINGNFTFVKNKVNKFKGTDEGGQSLSGTNLIWEGHPINTQYMLRVDRIIQTDEDLAIVQKMIDDAPVNENGKKVNPFAAFGTPQKGDLLYKDINKDGIVDMKDREIVSDGPNPKFQFGLNLNAAYKGIDFSVLFQGQAGVKVFWQDQLANVPVVRYGWQLNKHVAEGRWYEGRTDATYPRLLETTDQRNCQKSDFYLQNKSYLKIRNIQLGYTFPKEWMEKIQLERIRLYGSLENFFTFTSFKGFDPEMGGVGYPAMKSAVVGVNVTF